MAEACSEHNKVNLSVFSDICDALKRVRENEASFNEIWKFFGNYWPLKESCLKGIEGDNPREAIEELIKTYGKKVLEYSHGSSKMQRDLGHLEDSWKEQYKDHFTRLTLKLFTPYFLPDHQKYRELPLKILVVDNEPKEIVAYNQYLPPQLGFAFWKNAEWYVYSANFANFENTIYELKSNRKKKIEVKQWNPMTGERLIVNSISMDEIDLILQDQFLNETNRPDLTGSRLAEHYVDVAPQALVFLTTGTDIGELAALGETHFVDRVIAKNKLASLPWHYYLAFNNILGSMFWEGWLSATDNEKFGSRKTIRHLLGTIRKWQKEPDILWHAQSLPEMVDHSHPHITDLWKMTNEILGIRNDKGEPIYSLDKLTIEERIILALAIWLHDMGHRGDEFRTDSIAIRDVHGSISESLLVFSPKAFGLEWLVEYCDEVHPGFHNRNEDDRSKLNRLENGNKICPLRMVGLVCRHHQSSAPLAASKLSNLITGLKSLSDYSRVGYDYEGNLINTSVKDWCDDGNDLDWMANDIRSLDEFDEKIKQINNNKIDILKVACLLRLLDAIHLHQCRAGSITKRKTHQDYLDRRKFYCERERDRLNRILVTTDPGSKAYLDIYNKINQLTHYLHQILETQGPHLWRQQIVENREIKIEDNKVVVTFILRKINEEDNELWNFKHNKDIWIKECDKVIKTIKSTTLKNILEQHIMVETYLQYVAWTINFIDDVLGSELDGQKDISNENTFLLTNIFKSKQLYFKVKDLAGNIEYDLGSLEDC